MSRVGGRPLKFNSAKKMQEAIDNYFDDCDYKEEPQTMSGLANALGMTRQSLVNYAKRDKFFDTLKKAKSIVEEDQEKRLIMGRNVTGVIFNLKNNFGWRDKAEMDVNAEEETVANKLTEVFGFAQQKAEGSS